MRILVTGGAGFIGSNLCEYLRAKGIEVVVVDDLSSGKKSNLSTIIDDITFFHEKIESFDFSKCDGVDAIVHLAAQPSVPFSITNFKESSTTNMLGTIQVVDYCSVYKIPLIYASSSAIYGGLELGNDTSSRIDLLSPYATDKYAMELYSKTAHTLYKLSSVGLRFFNVYGPRQDASSPYSGVISIFTDRILNRKPITIYGGHQTRDFIFIDDIVESIHQSLMLSFETSICEQVNVLTGVSVSIDSLADRLMNLVNIKVEKEYEKLPSGDPEQSNGTVSKMVDVLGVDTSSLVKLDVGLEKTVEFIRLE
ncbi:UDP-glucose 4-epimerase [hydrothermal vent metagenome]|uniref:UDP-glucose 4-epimerase n=1 Tax=hydrothermal vent metagenome TaxID=652676 RepID=A0A3B0YSX3_9ZZZZ